MKLEQLVSGVFSLCILTSILGGGLVFLMFAAALVLGGETGEMLAVSAKDDVMPFFIRTATLGILAALISFYLTGRHALSIEKAEK